MTWRSRDIAHVTPALSYSSEEATAAFRLPADRDLKHTRTINLTLQGAVTPKAVTDQRLLKHEAIRRYFHYTFEVYERIFESLACDEAFWIQPVHKLRHPMLFYHGHTAAFYINKLSVAGLTTRINQTFEEMFAVGVDEMSWDDLNEGHYDWPHVAQVWQYRRLVRDRVEAMFQKWEKEGGAPLPLTFDNSTSDDAHSFYWCIMMGIEHERIHLETASIHLRELPLRLVRDTGFWRPHATKAESLTLETVRRRLGENDLVGPFGGRDVLVARQPDDPQYGWDCDYSEPGVTIHVDRFEASKRLVSNAEFYDFIQAGGYTTQGHWDDEGWRWVSWKKPSHPWFWVAGDAPGQFRLRVQVTEIPLPWDWPVEINHLEARAYANWHNAKTGAQGLAGVRLPTEAEWIVLRDDSVGHLGDQWQWKTAPGNINFEHEASSCPVDRHAHGQLFDVVGNVWQHCDTPVYPFKGYRTHPFYDDFSLPTFDGRHSCMRGGCWIATGNEATRDARFAFRRHFMQAIGIRLVRGSAPIDERKHLCSILGMDPEVDRLSEESFTIKDDDNVRVQIARLAVAAFDQHYAGAVPKEKCKVFDVACGAGRTAYELTKTFNDVTGTDFSARWLQPAYSIREKGNVQFSVIDATTKTRRAVSVDAATFAFGPTRRYATFYQADNVNLHAHLTGYAMATSFCAIERALAYDPAAHIPHLLGRIVPGGLLVVVSSFVACESAVRHGQEFNLAAILKRLTDSGEASVVEGPSNQVLTWHSDRVALLPAQGAPLQPASALQVIVLKKATTTSAPATA